jgi:hypothetical protein
MAGSAKASRQFKDFDYMHKLDPESRAWLEQFSNEFYNNYFLDSPIHTNTKLKLEVFDQDNSRRRTVEANLLPSTLPTDVAHTSPEDALIEMIDRCRKQRNE